jgi:hypothetical protein
MRHRRTKGRGPRLTAIKNFLTKAHSFVRKHKLVSRGANLAAKHDRFKPYAEPIAKYASKMGYGRKRGYGLKLAGGGLGLAGGRKCGHYCHRKKR